MDIEMFLSLSAVGMLPVIASVALSALFRRESMQKVPYMQKQILAGLIFGAIAVCATEFGVPFNDTIVNVRDAAPICAALIFGAPAGIIAGVIGAAERWFAVYWGRGYFTRLGCTIATFLAGVLAGVLRKRLFNDQMPPFGHALVIAVVTEVIHMIMIFITNLTFAKDAFRYIQACTLPMVIVNALSASLAVYAVRRFEEGRKTVRREGPPKISELFESQLVKIVLLTYFITSGFTYLMQNEISKENTARTFEMTLVSVVNDALNRADDDIITLTRRIEAEINKDDEISLKELADEFDIYAINIINREGKITRSNLDRFAGGDTNDLFYFPMMYFTLLGEDENTLYVSSLDAPKFDPDHPLKECVVRSGNVLIQIFLTESQLFNMFEVCLPRTVANRQIGEDGGILVMNQDRKLIYSTTGLLADPASDRSRDFSIDLDSMETYTLQHCTLGNEDYYCMYTEKYGYYFISVLSEKEADFSKDLAVHLNFFLLTITFGLLFVMIFISIRKLIVGNISKVNESLSEITDGNLDTVVNVRASQEFVDLSDDINQTVDTLKRYIAEANARIDTELKYAREIQFSALPSVYPDREEIELFALMDRAREVGGDFYDFYFLDRNELVFLIADVSGKGIPASLFMMRAKTILKSFAENRIPPAEIFARANEQLCEGNETNMFVTAWMGILDLENGELKYVNAGHNHPLLRRKGGTFEYLKDHSGFVLAGMEGITYKAQTVVLDPSDEIFLYTDGVVEATDANEQLYGDDRLQNCLNAHLDEDAQSICAAVRKDVDDFYNGSPQFDDITEISVKFRKYMEHRTED